MENASFTTPQKRPLPRTIGYGTGLTLMLLAGPALAFDTESRSLSLSQYTHRPGVETTDPASPPSLPGIGIHAEPSPGQRGGAAVMLLDMLGLPGKYGLAIGQKGGRPAFRGLAMQPTENTRVILNGRLGRGGRAVSGSVTFRLEF